MTGHRHRVTRPHAPCLHRRSSSEGQRTAAYRTGQCQVSAPADIRLRILTGCSQSVAVTPLASAYVSRWPRPEIPDCTGKLPFYAIRSRSEAGRWAWGCAHLCCRADWLPCLLMPCLQSVTEVVEPEGTTTAPARRLRCGAEGARQAPKCRPERQISAQRR